MTVGDVCVLLVAITVTVLIGIHAASMQGEARTVQIEANGRSYLYDLHTDQEVRIDGLMGPSIISIANQQVRFVDSPCRDKLCVHHGAVTDGSSWAACLPNRVMLRIRGAQNQSATGEGEADATGKAAGSEAPVSETLPDVMVW
jgi:hypothetical protein